MSAWRTVSDAPNCAESWPQRLVPFSGINRTLRSAVPAMLIAPPTAMIDTSLLTFTIVPGDIVRVTPEGTIRLETTIMVPIAGDQAVFAVRVPPTKTIGSWRMALARFEKRDVPDVLAARRR